MRAGLSTIQQTLTPEAAGVLSHSIAEAGRRNHVHTTPLHVAATLLSSPTDFLRQACIKSHPNSSHPLQCRALELCFSVALERLPTAQNMSPAMEPPISNALMAALKRAQAHQRRGCPEQQQQPLLAIKVELEQLIISILDDPSVSRVMREASFSSLVVKATIEQNLNSSPPVWKPKPAPIGLNFRQTMAGSAPANRNFYMNPRFNQEGTAQSGQQRGEEIKRVVDILLRRKKKNPILVGESEPEAVTEELLRRIENKEMGEGPLENIQVIHLEKEIFSDKTQIPMKIKELEGLLQTQMRNVNGGRGVILNLGNLKWIVEQLERFAVAGSDKEEGLVAVAEMGNLLARFGENIARRLWLIGTATCETYLRCQIRHPSLENDWDLQALPMAPKAPLPTLFPRLGSTGILSSSVECLSPMKGFPAATVSPARILSENLDSVSILSDRSSEVEQQAAGQPLPRWLQDAKTTDKSQVNKITGEKIHKERINDFPIFISSPRPESFKLFSKLEVDLHKKLLKGLMEKVWWQPEAASAIATAVTQCKLENGNRRPAGSKDDICLLFIGSDRVGKKEMISALAKLVSGSDPLIISLGSRRNDEESNVNFRGKTVLDRISEVVRRNPFSIIMIEDIDEADSLTRASIKSTMERGRISDSHGREISLGNVIFVFTSNYASNDLTYSSNGTSLDEEKLESLAKGNWQLRLSLSEKTTKRKANWLIGGENPSPKPRKEAIGFDLNETADIEDDIGEGSNVSSDLTVENGNDRGQTHQQFSVSRELIEIVDNAIVFKPVDFEPVKHNISSSIMKKFSAIVGDGISIEIQEEALERILSGVWLGKTKVEDWTEKVLLPSFHELVGCLHKQPSLFDDSTVVNLELDGGLDSWSRSRGRESLLPSSIKVIINK